MATRYNAHCTQSPEQTQIIVFMPPKPSAPKPPRKGQLSAKGSVRIIAGRWRRHTLTVLAHDGLRPSSDRVRETVFNWLNHLWGGQFDDKCIVDAFAGTGAFGLECVSRGARSVRLIETHAPAVAAMRTTLAHWQQQDPSVAQVRVLHSDALSVLVQLHSAHETLDFLVLDPPFGHDWLTRLLPALVLLHRENGLVYVELEKNARTDALRAAGLVCVRSGHTQQVQYGLWRWDTQVADVSVVTHRA